MADEAVARGLADGTLAEDTRLRDALRAIRLGTPHDGRVFATPQESAAPLRLEAPTLADDAAYAVEAAVLDEADIVRAQRQLDVYEERLRLLERRRLPRLFRPGGL